MKRTRDDAGGSAAKSVSFDKTTASKSADSLKIKQLALKSSLNSALYTDAGVSDSQFNAMWAKCNSSGNRGSETRMATARYTIYIYAFVVSIDP